MLGTCLGVGLWVVGHVFVLQNVPPMQQLQNNLTPFLLFIHRLAHSTASSLSWAGEEAPTQSYAFCQKGKIICVSARSFWPAPKKCNGFFLGSCYTPSSFMKIGPIVFFCNPADKPTKWIKNINFLGGGNDFTVKRVFCGDKNHRDHHQCSSANQLWNI